MKLCGERRLKVTKRSLREGKSQSLILLTGLEPEDKDDTHSKNKDEELRKANSEADPRYPMRSLDPIRPDPIRPDPIRPDPPLHPKPVWSLPPKPAVAAKPPLPTPASPAGAPPSSGPPASSVGRVQLRAHPQDGRPAETTAQNGSQEGLPPAPSPWRCPGPQDRSGKAQSVTDDI
ncbi:hypothetical protein EYF80_049167 [Liparis tanakae]|uniref:Uncharacterized protein n=1 Tax=Liparis tanakae TaxID=230148 RepID=A0A4Z2FIR4_9TELE|nr:hypothetical protein EYF80_049167 [Liparis tanakae]